MIRRDVAAILENLRMIFTKSSRRWKIAGVRISQRKFIRGSGRIVILFSILGFLIISVLVALQWRPAKVIAKNQRSLIDGIERRSPARIQRLLSKDYSDRWGFKGEDLVETMTDAGSQFLALVVTPEDETIVIAEGRATVTAKLMISGKPVGPAGLEVTRQVNLLKEPFVFTWEKQSFLPNSWRLVRVDNPALPDDLYGYEPGDIRRAMKGE